MLLMTAAILYTALFSRAGGGGAMEQHANCMDIEWDEVQPGGCCSIRRMNTSASPQATAGWAACWWCIAPLVRTAWRSHAAMTLRQLQERCGIGMNRGQRKFLCPLFFLFGISDISAFLMRDVLTFRGTMKLDAMKRQGREWI